jgi:vesicular inhibitory amino acid transporter
LYFNRQSIDILSSVQSPSLSFLGTPTLSRISNSFLHSSFRGKTPEVISNLVKPLLRPTTSDEQQQQQQQEDIRKSSQYLLPSKKPSLQQIPEDQKALAIGHGPSPYQQCSYTQGAMNGKHLEQVYEVISRMYVALDFIDC